MTNSLQRHNRRDDKLSINLDNIEYKYDIFASFIRTAGLILQLDRDIHRQ